MVTTEIANRATREDVGTQAIAEERNSALTVAATVLGERPFRFETVLHASDQVPLTFLCPYQIVINAPVKLETGDRLWMGKVVRCMPEEEQWRTSIDVEHCLTNLPDLLSLAARFE